MSDLRRPTFREQLKESNQRFKDEMKSNNSKFKTDIKNSKPLTAKGKRFFRNVGVILLLIFLYPIGLFAMFKKSDWSKISKTIATVAGGIFFVLMIIAFVNTPPTVNLDNIKTDGNKSVEGESFNIVGSVYPANSTMTVNGKSAKINGQGKFNYSVPLKEGDNDITIITKNGDKKSTSVYKIHRYTKAELAAIEKAAAKKKADAAAADAKKKADDAAAAQAEQQKAAAAKAKADADAAAAAAKAKADAAAAAVTVSQKNALNKAKSYLSYASFSHDGLVDQLVYEQFSTEDATYAADNVGADWNEQAADKAKEYMSYSSFSRGGLIDQLEYEKFTPDQAAYGANAVGL